MVAMEKTPVAFTSKRCTISVRRLTLFTFTWLYSIQKDTERTSVHAET